MDHASDHDWADLPLHALVCVFSHLRCIRDTASCLLVCASWQHAANTDSIWHDIARVQFEFPDKHLYQAACGHQTRRDQATTYKSAVQAAHTCSLLTWGSRWTSTTNTSIKPVRSTSPTVSWQYGSSRVSDLKVPPNVSLTDVAAGEPLP